jgi:hypothetical protein
MIDELKKKLRKKPTRDDVLCAVSAAFDGAKVVAVSGSWSLHVETVPPREINVTERWLADYVEEQRLSRAELEQHFRRVKNSGFWAELPKGGGLAFLLT